MAPVYGHGLCSALAHSGMRSALVPDLEELEAAAGDGATCLLVVPQELGTRALAALDGRRRRVELVLLLRDDRPSSYLTGLRAGARSFVHPRARLPEVVAVLRGAARGLTLLPPAVVRSLCRPLHTQPAPQLSERERSWLRQIAAGVTVAELAQRSSYSEREMYRLLGSVYRRLGAKNRTEALFTAQRSGLLADPR
ncbi:LuxR C-terminal-related transcriptional regulator [Quadrisphaera sp. DSM 44207]|uniref:response regulator transcription factor n=1 Tax=Quadrisphaera sp. DSM 44207 TaxID=1881057 RepID=UPI000891B7FB|nr:LuxR C-terminal-related transcriptional regulator [Quadrisphaera sp. DSM 44207]SDQ10006.1 DNA-binding response regulator, NarL/FixJ family, contains REC and HTH domains [Quadrisphaera sp. DSM 44207]